MPSARARRRGAFLNWRFAVNGIQNAECSRSVMKSARLFMAESRIAERAYEAYSFANLRGRNHSAHLPRTDCAPGCRSIATRKRQWRSAEEASAANTSVPAALFPVRYEAE